MSLWIEKKLVKVKMQCDNTSKKEISGHESEQTKELAKVLSKGLVGFTDQQITEITLQRVWVEMLSM